MTPGWGREYRKAFLRCSRTRGYTVDVGLCCLTVTLGVLFSNSIIDGNIRKIKESKYATSILAHKKNTQNRIKVYSGYDKSILPYMENKGVKMNLGLPVSFSDDEFVIGPCRSAATHDNDRE